MKTKTRKDIRMNWIGI